MRSKFLRSMTVGATAVGVLLLPTAAFAQAADPPGRAQQPQSPGQSGDAASGAQDGDGFTEDNDTNDGDTRNNVADDGDNAHPSGKDRSVEHGRSGNQGKAQSDPDDDGRGPDRSNGGVDQANGEGGVDKADQDGNDGCGNDDDFEDDNEGLCGGPTAASDAPGDDGQDEEQDRRQGRSEEDRRQARNDQRQDDQRRQQEPKDDQRRQQEPKDEQRRQQEPKDDRRQDADRASADQAVAEIDVVFSCTEVSVTSTKDLSNVVLVFEDGSTQKLDGLSGQKGTFSGTGQNAGKTITTVYVKSGSNASGEGPGYGERFDSDATACAEGSPGPEGPTGTDDGTDGDGTTGTDGDGTTGTDGDGTTGTDGDLGVGGERITNDREEAVDGVSGPSVPVQGELEVGGVVIDRAAPILTPAPDGASADVQAAGSQVEAQPMPRTGASAVPMAVAAAIALLLGFGLVREPRRT